jgi:hypothetical protein
MSSRFRSLVVVAAALVSLLLSGAGAGGTATDSHVTAMPYGCC